MVTIFKFRIKEFGTRKIIESSVQITYLPEPGTTIKIHGHVHTITSVFMNAACFGTITVMPEKS